MVGCPASEEEREKGEAGLWMVRAFGCGEVVDHILKFRGQLDQGDRRLGGNGELAGSHGGRL